MNLKTIIFVFVSLVLLATLASGQSSPYNKLDKLKVNDLIAGKLQVQSTTNASLPCPSMTQVQRDAVASPTEGLCVYNSDSNTLNIYDGTDWVEVGSGGGGGGGIANWETAKFYEVGDVVIESTKIYQANTQHTSTVFASDIANWTKLVAPISLTSEVSGVLPMANGGTDKNLSPVLGGVVYTDAGSMEVLGAGASGQFLKSNGGAAPSWEDIVVNDSSFSGLLSLSKGGTNKNLSAEDGAILYLDTDSVEKLSPGTSGQVLQSNGAGAPSFANKSISAKSENGSSITLEEIQVSNNLLTQTDTNKHLIESGNNNILVNPSFEHSTFSTGWTNTNGVFAEDTIVELHGKKAAKVTLTAQALSLHQDSTLYQSQFADGVQGLASVRVKTSVSGIKVCSKQAGIITSNLCVDVQANNKWGLYKVPFILGGTSNGISINSNSVNVTGDVYIDDAFVGANDLTQNISACNSVNCETVFSAYIATNGTVSQENLDFINGNCTFGTTVSCNFNSGVFTLAPNVTYMVSRTLASAGACGAVGNLESTATTVTTSSFSSSFVCTGSGGNASYTPEGGIWVTVYRQGTDFTAAKQLSNGNTYSSTAINNIDRIGEIIFTTKSTAPNGFISALNSSIGQSGSGASFSGDTYYTLYEHLWNVPGLSTTAGDPYRISSAKGASALADWQSNKTITVDYATNEVFVRAKGSARNAGSYQDSDNKAHTHNITTRTSSGVAGANVISSSNTASTYTDTISINSSGGTESRPKNVALFAYIRFSGDTILAVAQLSGLESCTNTLECTDTFSAKISSTGVTSEENVDFLSGNCSLATNVYTCTFNASIFTVAPNCVISPLEPTAINGTMGMITTQSSSSLVYKTVRHDSAALAAPVNLICQKQGADYVGKTAKAVASDQNVATPGKTNSTLCSAKISSTGVISDQKGGCFASCTNATTPVCTFTSNYWVSGQVPNCWVISTNGGLTSDVTVTSSTMSGTLLTTTFTPYSSSRNYFCHGERQ